MLLLKKEYFRQRKRCGATRSFERANGPNIANLHPRPRHLPQFGAAADRGKARISGIVMVQKERATEGA